VLELDGEIELSVGVSKSHETLVNWCHVFFSIGEIPGVIGEHENGPAHRGFSRDVTPRS
jgi:hypothetical protein